MRIFYLSNAIEECDFALLNEKAIRKPNPAGQNFHNKLIHALALFSQTEAYSLIPSQEGLVKAKTFDPYGPLRVHYLEGSQSKLSRYLLMPKQIVKGIESDFPDISSQDCLIYDSLNLTLSKAAKLLCKKTGAKRLAILSDDPSNLTGTKKPYQQKVISLSKDADGYFTLTEGLNALFNAKGKPCLCKLGIVDEIPVSPRPMKAPYIYYGGALFIKDGTKALIDSYLIAKPNIDLVIAGHGPYEAILKEKCKLSKRIHFLGQLSKAEHYSYLRHASLLINPRIYSKKLDEVSVPSKVLEYLASGSTILSTPSTRIFAEYGASINELENKGEDPTASLVAFYKEHIDESGAVLKVKPNLCPSRIAKELGPYAIGKALTDFIVSLDAR